MLEADRIRTLRQSGDNPAALKAAALAVRAHPEHAILWQLLAVCSRQDKKSPTRTIDALRRALTLEPIRSGPWAELFINTVGNKNRENFSNYLIRSFILDIKNNNICRLIIKFGEHYPNLLLTLVEQRPEVASHHRARAKLAERLGQPRDMYDGFRRALALDPVDIASLANLNRHPLGPVEAFERLRWLRFMAILSDRIVPAYLAASGSQPAMLETAADAHRLIGEQVKAIKNVLELPPDRELIARLGPISTFKSAYWDVDDTELLRHAGAANVFLQSTVYPNIAGMGRRAHPKQRHSGQHSPSVGIVTCHAFSHSVWEAIGQDWVERLIEAGVELVLYDIYGLASEETRGLFGAVAKGPKPQSEWVELLGCARHDILMFPEVGMDPAVLALASLRLAPLQIASWGHPTTTGLSTIDRYLSAERFECADSEAHYTEKLIRLPGVGVTVRPDRRPTEPMSRSRIGLEAGEIGLALTQNAFKYAPSFDAVLVRIAAEEPSIRFLVSSSGTEAEFTFWSTRIQKSFVESGLNAGRFIRIIPRLPLPDFRNFLATVDGYLDPPSFSGFNTGRRAIESGCPLVTFEGPRLRHRLAAGLLREAGCVETIARSLDQYVNIALRLAQEADFRQASKEAQLAGLDALQSAGTDQQGRPSLQSAFLSALDLND